MSDLDQLTPHHRDAIRVIRGHRAAVGRWWGVAAVIAVLGLGSCLLPFGLILNGVGVSRADEDKGPPAYVAWLIGGGLPAFIIGFAATLLLWQRPGGYERAEALIRLADRLGLRFAWPGSAWKWVGACQDLPGWPRARKRAAVSAGGVMLGERDGVAFALVEPSRMADLLADLQAFVPLRYTFRFNTVFAVRLDAAGRPTGIRRDGDLADEAVVVGLIDELLRPTKDVPA